MTREEATKIAAAMETVDQRCDSCAADLCEEMNRLNLGYVFTVIYPPNKVWKIDVQEQEDGLLTGFTEEQIAPLSTKLEQQLPSSLPHEYEPLMAFGGSRCKWCGHVWGTQNHACMRDQGVRYER